MSRLILGCGLVLLFAGTALPARAQTKPATSGAVSFNEPEMRKHRSGFRRPQRPRHGVSLRGFRH